MEEVIRLAKELEAALAGMGEPVAVEVDDLGETKIINFYRGDDEDSEAFASVTIHE